MTTRPHWKVVWIAGAIAVALTVVGAHRVVFGERITGPQQVDWRDAADHSIPKDSCFRLMERVLVIGDRLIEACNSDTARGFAWIEPKTKRAKVAWPITLPGVDPTLPDEFAAHDTTFGVIFGRKARLAGVAGPDGWIVAPSVIAESEHAIVLAFAWVDGAFEVVLTHPEGDDVYGAQHAPDIVRLAATGITRTSRPIPCDRMCHVVGALPTAHGWKLLVANMDHETVTVVGEDGTSAPAGSELQWWGKFEASTNNRVALGTTWGMFGDAQIAEPDGTLHAAETPPIAGYKPIVAFRPFAVIDGVIRERTLWSKDDQIKIVAQRRDKRTVVTATAPDNDTVQLVGDAPDNLRPTIRGSSTYDFRVGVFLPAPDGYYWLVNNGDYVTLDRELRRTDPLSLLRHLRTRGSVGNFIDEPSHVVGLFVLLPGPLVAFALGATLSILTKRAAPVPRLRPRPLETALIVCVVAQLWALTTVLPLLG